MGSEASPCSPRPRPARRPGASLAPRARHRGLPPRSHRLPAASGNAPFPRAARKTGPAADRIAARRLLGRAASLPRRRGRAASAAARRSRSRPAEGVPRRGPSTPARRSCAVGVPSGRHLVGCTFRRRRDAALHADATARRRRNPSRKTTRTLRENGLDKALRRCFCDLRFYAYAGSVPSVWRWSIEVTSHTPADSRTRQALPALPSAPASLSGRGWRTADCVGGRLRPLTETSPAHCGPGGRSAGRAARREAKQRLRRVQSLPLHNSTSTFTARPARSSSTAPGNSGSVIR